MAGDGNDVEIDGSGDGGSGSGNRNGIDATGVPGRCANLRRGRNINIVAGAGHPASAAISVRMIQFQRMTQFMQPHPVTLAAGGQARIEDLLSAEIEADVAGGIGIDRRRPEPICNQLVGNGRVRKEPKTVPVMTMFASVKMGSAK